MLHKLVKTIVGSILKNAVNGVEGKWQVQGLGMLRTYITPELRLHVWDKRFCIENVSPVHTHPWHLQSYIVAGVLRQTRYKMGIMKYRSLGLTTLSTPHLYNMATILCGENAHTLSDVKKVTLMPQKEEVYQEGDSYSQQNDEIHYSMPEDGTVTLVYRTFTENRDNAQVFWQGKGPFVSAAPRSATQKEIDAVAGHALATWFTN